jgi:Tfp pilus assembly pilus retraction ATPase PilT
VVKGKCGSGKNTSDVAVVDELDSWMKTKQLVIPEDRVELNEQVELFFCRVKAY